MKKYSSLSFALCALLFVSQTNAFNVSQFISGAFSGIKNLINNQIQENPIRSAAVIGSIAIAAIGIALITKRFFGKTESVTTETTSNTNTPETTTPKNDHASDTFQSFEIQSEEEKEILTQLDVYGQFNSDGGGGGSCGYHTLLRGVQCIKENDEAELQKDLTTSTTIQPYFGAYESEWRNSIIRFRKQNKIKKKLHEKLLKALRDKKEIPKYDQKIVNLYRSSFGNLENIILNNILINNENADSWGYEFTDEAIISSLTKTIFAEDDKVYEKAISPQTIAQYIDFEKMRQELLCKNQLLQLQPIVQKIQKEHEDGEWLNDGEMEHLWNVRVKHLIPLSIPCGFTAISNFSLIGHEGFDEVTPIIKEKIKPELNKNYCHVFAIGTMSQHGDKKRSSGHWFPLVMKNTQTERKYFVMDSMGTSRTQDERVLKLIDLIEKE